MTKLTINPQQIEHPSSDVSQFYLDKDDYWRGFNRLSEYTYDEGNARKPCIDLTCGHELYTMDYRHVLLLLETLKAKPEFLNDFMKWVHRIDCATIQPKRTSGTRTYSRKRTPTQQLEAEKPSAEMLSRIANIEFTSEEKF